MANGYNLFGNSLSSTSIPPVPPEPSENGFNEFGEPLNGLTTRAIPSGGSASNGFNEFSPTPAPASVVEG
jgi:hypothetical protein